MPALSRRLFLSLIVLAWTDRGVLPATGRATTAIATNWYENVSESEDTWAITTHRGEFPLTYETFFPLLLVSRISPFPLAVDAPPVWVNLLERNGSVIRTAGDPEVRLSVPDQDQVSWARAQYRVTSAHLGILCRLSGTRVAERIAATGVCEPIPLIKG